MPRSKSVPTATKVAAPATKATASKKQPSAKASKVPKAEAADPTASALEAALNALPSDVTKLKRADIRKAMIKAVGNALSEEVSAALGACGRGGFLGATERYRLRRSVRLRTLSHLREYAAGAGRYIAAYPLLLCMRQPLWGSLVSRLFPAASPVSRLLACFPPPTHQPFSSPAQEIDDLLDDTLELIASAERDGDEDEEPVAKKASKGKQTSASKQTSAIAVVVPKGKKGGKKAAAEEEEEEEEDVEDAEGWVELEEDDEVELDPETEKKLKKMDAQFLAAIKKEKTLTIEKMRSIILATYGKGVQVRGSYWWGGGRAAVWSCLGRVLGAPPLPPQAARASSEASPPLRPSWHLVCHPPPCGTPPRHLTARAVPPPRPSQGLTADEVDEVLAEALEQAAEDDELDFEMVEDGDDEEAPVSKKVKSAKASSTKAAPKAKVTKVTRVAPKTSKPKAVKRGTVTAPAKKSVKKVVRK